MRELHGRAAHDDMDTGTDTGAHASERDAGDSHRLDRAIVQDAETQTAQTGHSRTVSASRTITLPAAQGTQCRQEIRLTVPSPLEVPRVITPSRRQSMMPIRGTRNATVLLR
jgi:hypothetical protein